MPESLDLPRVGRAYVHGAEEHLRVCSCGFSAASGRELDALFLAVFIPVDSVGREARGDRLREADGVGAVDPGPCPESIGVASDYVPS